MSKKTAIIYWDHVARQVVATFDERVIPSVVNEWLCSDNTVFIQRVEERAVNRHDYWVYGVYIGETPLSSRVVPGTVGRISTDGEVWITDPETGESACVDVTHEYRWAISSFGCLPPKGVPKLY